MVAYGEIGLDYYWHKVDHAVQARAFQAQLELAAELGKPVIVHSREAAEEEFTESLKRTLSKPTIAVRTATAAGGPWSTGPASEASHHYRSPAR